MKGKQKMLRVTAVLSALLLLIMTGCAGKEQEKSVLQDGASVTGEEQKGQAVQENVGEVDTEAKEEESAESAPDPVPIEDPSAMPYADMPEFDSILQPDGKWPLKENGEKYKIGMSIPTIQEEIWQIQQTLIQEDAEKRGYEAVIQVADNDADRQIQQLQSLAAQGVDAIWVGAHDASTLGPVITEIADMGIPVVSQTRLPVDCPVAYHCNTDNTVLGTLHSEYIVRTLGITSGNFVILKGDARQITDVPQIYAGMMTEIQPYVDSGDIKIVLEQNCTDWKAEEAMKHAESALTLTNNEVDVFVCMNDGIASGVIAVLEQKGLAGKVIVTGMDSEGAALRRVMAGTQSMTIYKDITQMIQELANSCLAAKLGVKPHLEPNYTVDNGYGKIPTISMGAQIITKDNMNDILKDSYINLDEVLADSK